MKRLQLLRVLPRGRGQLQHVLQECKHPFVHQLGILRQQLRPILFLRLQQLRNKLLLPLIPSQILFRDPLQLKHALDKGFQVDEGLWLQEISFPFFHRHSVHKLTRQAASSFLTFHFVGTSFDGEIEQGNLFLRIMVNEGQVQCCRSATAGTHDHVDSAPQQAAPH